MRGPMWLQPRVRKTLVGNVGYIKMLLADTDAHPPGSSRKTREFTLEEMQLLTDLIVAAVPLNPKSETRSKAECASITALMRQGTYGRRSFGSEGKTRHAKSWA